MPSLNIPAKQIKGLVPALDRRTIQQPLVVDGQNFLVDLKGPYAAFSNRIFTYNKFFNPTLTRGFEIDGIDSLYATYGAIYRFNANTQRLILLFTFPDAGTVSNWSMANVNGIYYFARDGINGVVMYDPFTQTCQLLTNNVPANPISVCAGAGRLVIMSYKFVAWSALGDGTDLAPDLTTGAGFQPLSLMGGQGIYVAEVADGFISFTTKGAMKSEFAYFLNTFRHYPLDRSFVPLNSFCITPLDPGKEWLILDVKGFYSSKGVASNAFELFEPLMSEYFSRTLLPSLDLTNIFLCKLFYDQSTKQLYVSVTSPLLNGVYSYAYVFYRPAGEWGILNYDHYAFFHMSALTGVLKGSNPGFLSADLYFHYFVPDVFVENAPTDPLFYFYRLNDDTPIRIDTGVLIATADLHIHNEDESLFSTPGAYTIDTLDGDYTPYVPPASSLNSYVEIGLLRWAEQKYDDELSEVTNVKLSVDNFPGNQVFIDYNNVAVGITIDYNNVMTDTFEDWGIGVLSAAIFTPYIIATNDGFTTWNDQEEQLNLSVDAGDDKYYTCFNSGIFHTIRLEALAVNTTFHLRLMELSGTVGGRL